MSHKAKNVLKGSVRLNHPQSYAIFSCMANRFALQREEGFLIAHFGLMSKKEKLLDRYMCVLPEDSVKMQRENLVQYSDKIGQFKKGCPVWEPPPRTTNPEYTIPVVDFIHVSNWDDAYAEICFWNYSRGHVADISRLNQSTPVTPWGVGLIRCSLELQREFLEQLYDDPK